MFIKNLEINNFGCIDHISTSFDRINLITGDNGSGKSKFLSTIVYSLCNYLDEKVGDYVRTGSDNFNIDMNFSHLSNNYSLQIEGSKRGADKLLTVNGSETFKNSQVVEYIENYIHKPKLTLASSITMQGAGSDILFEPNQKRVERLKQIFDIDKLNLVGLQIKEKIDELKILIKELEIENATILNSEYNYKVVDDKPDELLLSNLKLQKSESEKEKSEYEKNLILYDAYCTQLSNYKLAQTMITSTNDKIQKLVDQKEVLENSLKEVDINELNTLINVEKESINSISTYKQQLDMLKKAIEIHSKLNKLTTKKDSICLDRMPRLPILSETVIDSLKSTNDQLAIMKDKVSLVEAGKCPTCGQEYHEYGTIEEFEIGLQSLEDVKKKLEEEVKNYEVALASYNVIKNENDKKELESSLLQDQIDQLNKDILIYNSVEEYTITYLKEQIDTQEKQLKDASFRRTAIEEDIDSNKEIRDSIKECATQITISTNEISNYSDKKKPEKEVVSPKLFDESSYNILCDKIKATETAMNEYESIISYNKMLKELEVTNNKKMQDNQVLLDKYRNDVKVKEQTKKVIEKDFSSWLIQHGSKFIKEKMNDFFLKSYGKFIIDLKQDAKSIDFYYSEDGSEYLNVAMASGYEISVLATSFRIALCSMQNMDFFLVDEIDSFSSVENSLKLYDSILNENFGQVFTITHHEETKDMLINKGAKIIEL